jgi:hypothetical protein
VGAVAVRRAPVLRRARLARMLFRDRDARRRNSSSGTVIRLFIMASGDSLGLLGGSTSRPFISKRPNRLNAPTLPPRDGIEAVVA